jgi:hypothetical protein
MIKTIRGIMIQVTKIFSFVLIIFLLTSCDSITNYFAKPTENESLFSKIDKMYEAYNRKDLNSYCEYFSNEINVFKESGLGNTRIITGKEEFRNYYQKVFKAKRTLKITPLSHFTVYPWIMVKELIENDDQVFEAAVGYRLDNEKIRDRMILSENFLVNKSKLSIELPRGKEPHSQAPPPYIPANRPGSEPQK